MFVGNLSSDSGKKRLDFDNNRLGVRVGTGGPKLGPNDKR